MMDIEYQARSVHTGRQIFVSNSSSDLVRFLSARDSSSYDVYGVVAKSGKVRFIMQGNTFVQRFDAEPTDDEIYQI